MSLSAGSAKMSFALKTLRARWDQTQMHWNDDVRQEFEEAHLKPVEQEIMAALNATNTLAQLILKAQQECS
jgi:hypothetical protein